MLTSLAKEFFVACYKHMSINPEIRSFILHFMRTTCALPQTLNAALLSLHLVREDEFRSQIRFILLQELLDLNDSCSDLEEMIMEDVIMQDDDY